MSKSESRLTSRSFVVDFKLEVHPECSVDYIKRHRGKEEDALNAKGNLVVPVRFVVATGERLCFDEGALIRNVLEEDFQSSPRLHGCKKKMQYRIVGKPQYKWVDHIIQLCVF